MRLRYSLKLSILLLNFTFFIYKHKMIYKEYDSVKASLELIHQFQDINLGVLSNANSYTRNVMVTRDLAKFYHPDAVLEDAYIFRQQAEGDSLRNYIRQNWFDSQPLHEVFQTQPVVNHSEKSQSSWTTLQMVAYSRTREGQYEFLGLFDRFLHLPLPEALHNKVTLAQYMNRRLLNLQANNASAQCLRDAQFQKKNYILDEQQDCQNFFQRAIQEYDNNSTQEVYNYVKKNNDHDQKGTELAFKGVFNQVASLYDYGNKCGDVQHTLIMQEYISNPLLIDGRKFDIRLHMMVTSTNPPIVYLYKKFYLMKCSYKFDYNEFRNQSHICSAGYQRRLHNKLVEENNLQELNKVLPITQITEEVTYDQFAQYLIREKKIEDKSWIQNYMIPEMEKRFYHYFQSYFDQEGHIEDPRIGEYNACEFNIDDKMNFWLLECTTNPNMIPGSDVMRRFQGQLHVDAIPILIAYARQKYLRIKKLMKELMEQIKTKEQLTTYHFNDTMKFIQSRLKDEPIDNQEFDKVFHRIDFNRAQSTCN